MNNLTNWEIEILLSFLFNISNCSNNKGISFGFSVSTAIWTIGSLYEYKPSFIQYNTANRNEESEGHKGKLLIVPILIITPSKPRIPNTLPAGTLSTATISRPINKNLLIKTMILCIQLDWCCN